MKKKIKDILAKIIRAFAVPPTFVAIMSITMYFVVPSAFRNVGDLIALLCALAVLPALAYPLAAVIPSVKEKGRSGSRRLAFVTSAVGYISGTVYAFATNVSRELKFIFCGYLIALVLLTVFNKLCGLKASGHACGIVGPLLYSVCFFGYKWIAPCVIVCIAVVWASVYRKSHTPKELLLGGMCAAIGFCVGFVYLKARYGIIF